MLNRVEIESLIPHQGSMCLLDEVCSWTEREVACSTRSHLDRNNPLRCRDQLAALHLIEYGAQATAIHGGLAARAKRRRIGPGMLVAVRDVHLQVSRLDDLSGALQVTAHLMLADAGAFIYRFEARFDERLIGSGKISIIGAR